MTSSHARVGGAKKYERRAGKYGRGITRRSAGCGWYGPRAERGGRGLRRRSVPFRSSTRSLRVGEERVVEGIKEKARYDSDGAFSRGGGGGGCGGELGGAMKGGDEYRSGKEGAGGGRGRC